MWLISYQRCTMPNLHLRTFSSVWIEKPLPRALFKYLKFLIIICKWVVLDTDKTDSLHWLRMWCPIYSPSGSPIFSPVSCTSQYPQEAHPDMVAASCSHPSENQYSCILVPSFRKQVEYILLLWQKNVFFGPDRSSMPKKYFRDPKFLSKVFLQVLQAVNPLYVISCDHNTSTYITNMNIFLSCIRQNTEWSFCERQRQNS